MVMFMWLGRSSGNGPDTGSRAAPSQGKRFLEVFGMSYPCTGV